MAKVERRTVDVERTVIEQQESIVLTLSAEEAAVVKGALGLVGGKGPAQQYVNEVYEALARQNVKTVNYRLLKGNLYAPDEAAEFFDPYI